MSTVYVETSFFSACVSTRTTPKAMGWKASSNEWLRWQAPRHELFVGPEVVRELSDPTFAQGPKALALLRGMTLLDLVPEAERLAELLVAERVMPAPSRTGDAVHVAVATIFRMEYILTWNVRHLANRNKRTHFSVICMRLGLVPPMIVTPDMLQDEG